MVNVTHTLAEGNDFPGQRHRPFVRLSEQRPGACKPLTLTPRAKRQNRLSARHPPAHPRTLQALAHCALSHKSPILPQFSATLPPLILANSLSVLHDPKDPSWASLP